VSAEIARDYPRRTFKTKDDDRKRKTRTRTPIEAELEPMTTGKDNDMRPRVNEEIGDAEVQLIDQLGKNLGVVKTQVAIQMATDAGSDLVEIVPSAFPPICKFLDRKLYARAK
jgi:hypothetical protein